MKNIQNLLAAIFLLTLLPASASAITITISAPSNSSTELTVTVTGEAYILNVMSTQEAYFANIGDYITNDTGPRFENYYLSSGITAGGETVTMIFLDDDGGANDDDLALVFDSFSQTAGIYTFSGSATIDLSSENHNFGQFNIGTYEDNGNTVIVQYSTVPDTGSTAALLGVGAAALAFARCRLG